MGGRSVFKNGLGLFGASVGLSALLALSACGGGGSSPGSPDALVPESATQSTPPAPSTPSATPPVVLKPATRAQAARFLTQASFGPTDADIDRVMEIGYEAWLDQQMAVVSPQSHAQYWMDRDAALKTKAQAAAAAAGASAPTNAGANGDDVIYSFWSHAVTAPDQLRQRIAFALSEIFVVSLANDCGSGQPKGVANYLDLLGAHAFSDYRSLLEQVARNPIMGCYLSHVRNEGENAITGRVPDENFAREVMQLFSIGLYQLDDRGEPRNGVLTDTYGATDVSGMAKVFTGFSWECPAGSTDACFHSGSDNKTKPASFNDRYILPMRAYAQFHSFSEKKFLGVTIGAQCRMDVDTMGEPICVSEADPYTSLKVALDTLSRHLNVAPFIGKQLIQRLVTSNPSPEYVERVTKASRTSGSVDMRAMVKAILLDPEARDDGKLSDPIFGKAREPILKLSAFLRAFNATSFSGQYLIGSTDNVAFGLGQSPLRATSVFNFFRPGYVPPGSKTAAALKVAPELQLAHESSVMGYLRFVVDILSTDSADLDRGLGATWAANSRKDVQLNFDAPGPKGDEASIYNLARQANADALIQRLNLKLMYGNMPTTLQAEIKAAVEGIAFKTKNASGIIEPTAKDIKNRLHAAILLTLASPEFQIQQ